jgi:hypothetical protein
MGMWKERIAVLFVYNITCHIHSHAYKIYNLDNSLSIKATVQYLHEIRTDEYLIICDG